MSLLPTQEPSTNRVVARNRRIGVSIIDVSGWKHEQGVHRVTAYLRKGYKIVCKTNRKLNAEAGVPEAIRKTTCKPGGTVPKLPGKTAGIAWPNFDYMIRRTRVQEDSPVDRVMQNRGYPREKDLFSAGTVIYEHPMHQGPAPPVSKVSLWEQAMSLAWIQREWCDNAASNTLTFRPKWPKIAEIRSSDIEDMIEDLAVYTDSYTATKGLAKDLIDEGREVYENDDYRIIFNYKTGTKILESIDIHQYDSTHEEDHVEPVLSAVTPLIKSLALLPASDKGAYVQMPEEGISESEYLRRKSVLKPVDWTQFKGSDGTDERYCQGDYCVVAK